MRLFELAFACRLYGPFGDYDSSLGKLRAAVGDAVDVRDSAHRRALFTWLREWGCRQFAIAHEAMAARSLVTWADRFLHALPPARTSLLHLSRNAMKEVAAAYEDLRDRTASWQQRRSGPCFVTFGPAGAAKTLFALRPNSLPPWDDPIRERLGCDESADSYCHFLADAKGHLEEVLEEAARFEIDPGDLPRRLGRPESSLAKLVDEYLWVRFSQGCEPPNRAELTRWLNWLEAK